MHVNELKAKTPQQLLKMAEELGIENPISVECSTAAFCGFARHFDG